MALLKAFVCQVILLGLYKVFLEQVIEQHLVPDELTRNCLVGFVCLFCFGIQIYTDNAGDDAEGEEDPKIKSKSRETTSEWKFEPAEIPETYETFKKIVESNESCHVMNANPQKTSQETATETKQCSKNQQVFRSSATEKEKVASLSQAGIFAEFSSNVPHTIEMAASTNETTYEQHTRSNPLLNKTLEVNICEDSDEEGIEIDQFISKESTGQAEELKSHQAEPTELEHVETDYLASNGPNSSSQDLDVDIIIDESKTINGKIEESLNKINKMSSKVICEIESKKLATEENKIEYGGGIISRDAPESHACAEDIVESLPGSQETNCTSSAPAKELNVIDKNRAETSTAQSTTALSPRRKSLSQNVVITSVNIDISFLYAFY